MDCCGSCLLSRRFGHHAGQQALGQQHVERGERRHVGHLRDVRLPAQCAQEHERRLPLLGRAAQRAVGPGDAQHAQRRRPVAGAHQLHEFGQRVCRLDGALHDGQPGKPGHQACPCDGVEGETAGLLSGERPLHPRVLLLPDRTHLGRRSAGPYGVRIHGRRPLPAPRAEGRDLRPDRKRPDRSRAVCDRQFGQGRSHARRGCTASPAAVRRTSPWPRRPSRR